MVTSPATSPAGYRIHLVNVWTPPEPGPTVPHTMIDSMLYLPEGAAPDVPRPGVVFVPGWGRYPYDAFGRALAPRLAEAGVAVLLLGIRRRGGEGQTLSGVPDSDLRDIKVGLDALTQHGVFSSVLVGQDVGALSVARYAATGDNRVAGVGLVDPIPDLHGFLVEQLGQERVEEFFRLARQTSYEWKSDLVRIDVDVPLPGRPPLWIHQPADPFLAWWSPQAALRLPHVLQQVAVPVLAVGTEAAVADQLPDLQVHDRDALVPTVVDWAIELLPRPASPSHLEIVEVTTEGDIPLMGNLRTPLTGARTDVAILVVHGLTTGPLSPMAKQLMPHYTDHGFAALAMETRRSGLRCIAESQPEQDNDDIAAFVELLRERGYEKVVLVGASMGSQAITRYVARRHDPAVAAVVHLAPTGDMDVYMRLGLHPDDYAHIVAQARQAVADGRGDTELLWYDLTERQRPSRFHSARRNFWRAESWLAWWGPDAVPGHTELMSEVDVPVLLVSGTADDYNDQIRMDELTAAAKLAPIVDQVWVGGDHGLRGVEGEAVAHAADWLERNGLVERRDPPPDRPLAGISPRLLGAHVYPEPPAAGRTLR